MKKILLILGVLIVAAVPANAEILKVQALSEFNTENPPSSIEVKAVSDMDLNEELLIMDGFVLKGNLVDVVSPKRLKRDATFSFVLTEYTDNNGKKHIIDPSGRQYKGKFTTRFNYKHAAKTAALSVGNFFLQGLSIGYAAVEGAVKNEEGNRVKSSAMSVYESTPISYVEKGEDIVILKDQVFCLKFKQKDDKKEINNEAAATIAPEKLPANAELQSQQENTLFQEKTNEEILNEPESISKEEQERRMNLKAPLPDEEYGVTIEDLQAEVLNKPKEDNVAFRFGRSDSKSEEQKEKSNLKSSENLNELSQPAQTTKTPEQTEQLEEKIEQQPASTDAEPVLENEKSAPADSAQSDNTPDLEDEKTEAPSGREFSNYQEFKPQSKTLKLRKNPKTDRLQPVEDIRPVKSEEIKTPLQEESSKPQALENKEEVQTILTEPKEEQQTEVPVNDTVQTVQQQSVPQESETINNSVQQSELNPQETVGQTDTEKYTIPTNTFNQSTAADETLKNNNDVASKPLKRHDADSFDNLVPEIPAPSEIPLAPLDLPDTY